MESAQKITRARARSRTVKRDWLGLLIVPVICAILISAIIGAFGYLITIARSETKIEKLEKDVDYIRGRLDYLIDRQTPPAR